MGPGGWLFGPRSWGQRSASTENVTLARDRVSRIIRKWEYSWYGHAGKLSSTQPRPSFSSSNFPSLPLSFYRALYLVFIPRKRFVAARSDARRKNNSVREFEAIFCFFSVWI